VRRKRERAEPQALRGQLSYVATLAEGAHLPPQLARELVAAEGAVAAFDLAQAEDALKRILPRMREITAIAESLGTLRERVEQQRGWIDHLTPLSPNYKERLLRVIDQELQQLDETLNASWPEPEQTKTTRENLPRYISVFTKLLTEVDDPIRRSGLNAALKFLEQGQFEAAEEAMKQPRREDRAESGELPEQSVTVEEALLPDQPSPATTPTRDRTRPRALARGIHGFTLRSAILRYAGFTTGGLIAVSVALLGMTLLYYPKDTFGGALDWLTLVLWGFGAQLTGFSLAQLGGKALGSGPRLTSAP
jgi:hypothetical protein